MTEFAHRTAPDATVTHTTCRLPRMLQIDWVTGPVTSFGADALSIDSWQENENAVPVVATLAVIFGQTAAHVEFDAAALREHAAACLRVADELDGGSGRQ